MQLREPGAEGERSCRSTNPHPLLRSYDAGCICLKNVAATDVEAFLDCHAAAGYGQSMLQAFTDWTLWCKPLVLAPPTTANSTDAATNTTVTAASSCREDAALHASCDDGEMGVPAGMHRIAGKNMFMMDEVEIDEAEVRRLLGKDGSF